MESLKPFQFAFIGNVADSRLYEELPKGRESKMALGQMSHGGDTDTITTSTAAIEKVAGEIDADVADVKSTALGVETDQALQGSAVVAFTAAFNDWSIKQAASTQAVHDMNTVLTQFVGNLVEINAQGLKAFGSAAPAA